MALQFRWWLTAGSLVLGLAKAASAQSVYGQEVLDVPLSTRLLMNFHDQPVQPCDPPAIPMSTRLLMTMHDQPAPSCYDPAVPMSTRLLMTLRSQSAGVHSEIPAGAAKGSGAFYRLHAPESLKQPPGRTAAGLVQVTLVKLCSHAAAVSLTPSGVAK